jgi:rhodanese-related sulfurtransferase
MAPLGSPFPDRWAIRNSAGCYVGAAAYRVPRMDAVTRLWLPRTRRYARDMDSDYSPQQVAELLQRSDVQLIDVRQPEEHEAGRIAGDRLVELTDLAAQAETIAREKPVIFYCRSGSRSAMATEAFRAAGFDAHNMTGGLLDWHAAGLPLEPSGGHVA